MNRSVCVYGIIYCNQPKKFGPIKKAQTDEIYTIPYRDVSCVVGDYSQSCLNFRSKERIAQELLRYQTVIENVMEEFTIIPFKFGTLVENKGEVKKVMESGYVKFKEKLRELDKKIELDVAAIWNDLGSVIEKIGKENEKIRDFKEEISKKPPQDTFQERIKIGSMIKDVLENMKSELQREILEFLKNKVEVDEYKKHALMDDRMIFNCAFLLDKNNEGEFDHALQEINEKHKERINFRCIGPLPPYSFSTYEVKKADFETIDKARELLNLGETLDKDGIKSAYRKLIKERHPDKFGNDKELKKSFEEIQRAYQLLLNYCGLEKKSLKKDDVREIYMIDILNIKDL